MADDFPELGTVYRRGPGSKSNQLSGKEANTKLNSEKSGNSGVNSGQDGSTPRPQYSQNTSSNVAQKLATSGNGESGRANSNNLLDKSDDEIVDSESDIVFDSGDDISLDDTDSDTDEKNHEGRKKSKWFRGFFDNLNRLSNEEIASSMRQWHCPACQGGPGAIDWYHGLQPILIHSRTIKSRRAKLHRLFAETLEEECYRRRAPLTAPSEVYGMWEGLDKKVKDHEIVWPPMVVIMNTRYEQDESNKWNGMGNQELMDYFDGYAASKARHAYGPQGHRGMSVLIFETSAAGYLEAVRLHKHFREQGRDREAWNHCKKPFVPGGKRQLYGYLASREDMDIFNQHSRGKSKLKFDMRSYQEMVESKIKDINEDSQQLGYYMNKVAKVQMKSQLLEDTLCTVSEKLRLATEDNRIVRERTKEQHLQNKEEMDAQEIFFQEQIRIIEQTIAAKEDNFEKFQQTKREKVKQSCLGSSENGNDEHRLENISSFTRLHDKEMRQFEAKRDNLIKIHEEKKMALKKKLLQEQLELEKELENDLTQLMDNYTSDLSQEGKLKNGLCRRASKNIIHS
ncbi:hypothetical protein RIF29_41701 [Crotalaria pallida]|uniref:XS domain-containing protein n=1 Tax=Crotalaria pallida TaxID=3830 RepID=A0AAN9E682_CROPI